MFGGRNKGVWRAAGASPHCRFRHRRHLLSCFAVWLRGAAGYAPTCYRLESVVSALGAGLGCDFAGGQGLACLARWLRFAIGVSVRPRAFVFAVGALSAFHFLKLWRRQEIKCKLTGSAKGLFFAGRRVFFVGVRVCTAFLARPLLHWVGRVHIRVDRLARRAHCARAVVNTLELYLSS